MKNYIVPAFALLPNQMIDKKMGMMLFLVNAANPTEAANKAKNYGQGGWMPMIEEINEIGPMTYGFNGQDCGVIVQWIR